MLTVVLYVVVTLVVAAALYGLSVVVFGRSELLPAVEKGHTVTHLPEGDLTGDGLRAVRFSMAPRGYAMADVDWTLEQAAAEIDRLRARLGEDETGGEGRPSTSSTPGRKAAPATRRGATR